MRILWFTSKLNFETAGGSVEEIDFVLRNLVQLGHEVTAVTCYSGENVIHGSLPYRVVEEQFDSVSLLGTQRHIYRLLKKYEARADIYIVDGHRFMYAAGLYRLLSGRVPIAAFINQYLSCWKQYESSFFPQPDVSFAVRIKQAIRRSLERTLGMHLANRVDMYAFVSPTLRKMYEDFGMRHEARDMVIGDPINIQGLMNAGNVTETSYPDRLKRTPPITLFFSSRMSPGKGFDMLLQGFARVKNKKDFRVILGGTGPEERYVRDMVGELGLKEYVTLTGWVSKEQLFAYYKEADVFIQADWWPAGTSISLIYALAFGVPSILPGGGGLEWNAGKSALYFPYRDPDALARRIEEMGSDHVLRAELSAQCYARLKENDMDYPARIKEFAARLKAVAGK